MKVARLAGVLVVAASMVGLLIAAAGLAQPRAPAQIAFELQSGWRQTVPYSSHEDWTLAEGGLWFQVDELDIDDAGVITNRSARIERADAITGERTVVASGPGLLRPTYVTPDHLIATHGTPSVIDRKSGLQTGSGAGSADKIVDVMIEGTAVYALRRRLRNASGTYTDMFLTRFDIDSMAVVSETKLPHLTEQARFMDGVIVGIGPTQRGAEPPACESGSTCAYTLFRTSLDGKIHAQLALEARKRSDAASGCIATIALIAADTIFVNAGCGTYLAIDAAVTHVSYSLPWPEVDKRFDLAAAGDILLARPEIATQMYGEKTVIEPVEAFDVKTGKPLGSAMLPPGKLRTMGDKVVLATRSPESQIIVLVYGISLAW